MGIGIHYSLQLPGDTSAREVRQVLARLRTIAGAVRADRLSPVFSYSLRDLLAPPTDAVPLERHFHHQATLNLYEVDVALERVEHRDRRAALGFSVHPGRGCDAAAFGFMRPGLTAAPADFDKDKVWSSWWWSGFCETQYASIVGADHLIECHLAVIHLLDEAERIGVGIIVHDQAEYWDTRSIQHLLQEVDRANGIKAPLV